MAQIPLLIDNRLISVHKAIISADFTAKTVLVENTWEYVEMWIKRNISKTNQEEILFFWNQARIFFEASTNLPKTASPLTAYYCFLNATKTLLLVKGEPFNELHGIKGGRSTKKTSLIGEQITFMYSGILPSLCKYYGETVTGETYNLRDVFYNLPFIHRAYTLTFENQAELFIPITNPQFVKIEGTDKAFFSCEIKDTKYQTNKIINSLPAAFERDLGFPDKWIIRKKKRFNWTLVNNIPSSDSFKELVKYHAKLRNDVQYIVGDSKLWYIKIGENKSIINRNSVVLTFAAMHRLSELARYSPISLLKHFECQHNWLLSEFIYIAMYQFLDSISSEITGKEFMTPGRRTNK